MRLQDLAAAAERVGHPGLIGQIRCDLFLGMLDGRFHGLGTEQIIAVLIAQYRPDGPGAVAVPGGPHGRRRWRSRDRHFDQPSRIVEGPILRPYRPVERPRPPPPPRRELPDEPPF